MSLAKAIAALSFGSIMWPAPDVLCLSTLLTYSEKIKVNDRHKLFVAAELTLSVSALDAFDLGVICRHKSCK
jgi:hypothetical protein